MNENLDKVQTPDIQDEKQPPVDDKGGFMFSSAVKISDPNTKEILVQMRGDY
jgi:hypothetical protein